MSEHKEFWNVLFEDGTSEIYGYERAATSQENAKLITHVIEYEAFENLCREMVQVKHLANTWFDENKKLKEQNEIMREALEFYGNEINYSIDDYSGISGEMITRCILYSDCEERNDVYRYAGLRARQALAKVEAIERGKV